MTIPNKGARVSELSIQDMRALYAVRITLESEAVRTARPLSADEAKALRSILNDIQVALDAGDTPKACACTVSSILLYARRESGWCPIGLTSCGSMPSVTDGLHCRSDLTARIASLAR